MTAARIGAMGAALSLLLCSTALADTPDALVAKLADAYVDARLAFDPVAALPSGLVDPGAIKLPDKSAAAVAAYQKKQDQIAASLAAVDARALSDKTTYAILQEALTADRQLRACRWEEWNVSHLTGWTNAFTMLAGAQPVATPEQRARALATWADLPAFVDVEIANLRRGVANGRTAARPVVARVIGQLDAALAAPPQASPFFVIARKAQDEAFSAQTTALITDVINPAVARYRDFLRDEYLAKARTQLGVGSLPDGAACYQGFLRAFTTLDRTPRQVADVGKAAVAANAAAVAKIGRDKWGAKDFADTVRKAGEAKDNRFTSEQELLAFSTVAMELGRTKTAPMFTTPPTQAIVVLPLRDFQRGSGLPSHYEPSRDPAQPAIYRSASEQWAKMSKGDAEVTAVHEAVPGHHLQTSAARALPAPSRIARLTANSAYIEGWARYAEGLTEEAGGYATPYAAVARRVWAARGMVMDPGLHVLGWSREQAVAYAMESGRFTKEEAEGLVDRSAALPGQLTSYDSGGLEIAALRRRAEKKFGDKFDLKTFHDKVLEVGAAPLSLLRAHVNAWIDGKYR